MALLKVTLDVLVLKALSWGPMHGFEIIYVVLERPLVDGTRQRPSRQSLRWGSRGGAGSNPAVPIVQLIYQK